MITSSPRPVLTAPCLLPPSCGFPPVAPAALAPHLQRLYALRVAPPTIRQALRDDVLALPRALLGRPYTGRHRGLSRPQTRRWGTEIAGALTPAQRGETITYARACQEWYRALAQQTETR